MWQNGEGAPEPFTARSHTNGGDRFTTGAQAQRRLENQDEEGALKGKEGGRLGTAHPRRAMAMTTSCANALEDRTSRDS